MAVNFNDRSGVIKAIKTSTYGPRAEAMNKWFPNGKAVYANETITMLLKGYVVGTEKWKERVRGISNSVHGPSIETIYEIYHFKEQDDDEDVANEFRSRPDIIVGAKSNHT